MATDAMNVVDKFLQIVDEEGPSALWSGVTLTIGRGIVAFLVDAAVQAAAKSCEVSLPTEARILIRGLASAPVALSAFVAQTGAEVQRQAQLRSGPQRVGEWMSTGSVTANGTSVAMALSSIFDLLSSPMAAKMIKGTVQPIVETSFAAVLGGTVWIDRTAVLITAALQSPFRCMSVRALAGVHVDGGNANSLSAGLAASVAGIYTFQTVNKMASNFAAASIQTDSRAAQLAVAIGTHAIAGIVAYPFNTISRRQVMVAIAQESGEARMPCISP